MPIRIIQSRRRFYLVYSVIFGEQDMHAGDIPGLKRVNSALLLNAGRNAAGHR